MCSCMESMSVMQMLYGCVLCSSWVLHNLQFVNAGQGCKSRPYGILKSRSYDCLLVNHACLLLFTPSCCGECFYYMYRGLCACTEKL